MGGGCLAPRPLQGDLASQLIDELHQALPSVSRQQRYLQNDGNYAGEKQKMFKKGPLRKLIDYLSSHRHKLVDSLAHNLKICIQKGSRHSWMVGLIILERIVMMGGQGSANGSLDKLENILRNKGQNSSFNESERVKTELRTLKTESEKQNRSGYYSVQQSPTEAIINQVSSARFQSFLLDTITACLDDQSLYPQALRILCQYINIKPKNIQNQEKVLILLKALMENLKIDYQSMVTLETYYRLLSKLKDKVILTLSCNLKTVIKMWIEYKGLIENSKSIQLINRFENKISTLQLIIARFLTSSLNGMQYKSLISLLLQIQDEHLFGLSQQFQSLYVYILNNCELGEHLMKALFLQYLRYGVMGNFASNLFKDMIQSSQELLSCHNQTSYRHLKNRQARENLFSLIKRWLVIKKYINLQDIIKYHSSLLIFCFLETFTSDHKIVCMEIIKQITPQQKIILIETIFDIYQRPETSPKIRYMLFQFHRTLCDDLKEITLMANTSRFVVDVSSLTTTESIQELASLMALYSNFDRETILLYMQQICQLLASALQFLGEDREGNKNELIASLLSFISAVITIEGIAVAFYQKLLRVIEHKQLKENQNAQLTTLLHGMENIFADNYIQNYKYNETCFGNRNDEADLQQNSNSQGFQKCKSYFRDLGATQTRSKFYNSENNFEKLGSVMKDQAQLKQQQSLRDIMEMINN